MVTEGRLNRLENVLAHLNLVRESNKMSKDESMRGLFKVFKAYINPYKDKSRLVIEEDLFRCVKVDLDDEDIQYFIDKYTPEVKELRAASDRKDIVDCEAKIAQAKKRLNTIL
jgi:hypothetical protein